MNTFNRENSILEFKIHEMYYKKTMLTQQYVWKETHCLIYLLLIYNDNQHAVYRAVTSDYITWGRMIYPEVAKNVIEKHFSEVIMEILL